MLSWYSPEPAARERDTPVKVTHRLFKLIPDDEPFSFRLEAVTDGIVSSSALYLDEIELESNQEEDLRFSQVEVPLPPGADVEKTIWGINVQRTDGSKGTMNLDKARNENGDLMYMIPVDRQRGQTHFHHLVRFSQKGEFTLPAVRFRRSYAPEQQVSEQRQLLQTVTVR
ncbi:MAG: hypothetical protein XXXJIFNMEKO3_03205 [Candidatus Erwinia impunctatus]